MRKLDASKRAMILTAMVEGNSVNAIARMCDVSKLTVLRLLNDVGSLCREFHELTVCGLKCKRVQVDEIWSFVGCKEKAKQRGAAGDGDCWTWVAIDADTKLVISYLVGKRDATYASEFMWDVADRVEDRIQLTSDGNKAYLQAVHGAFGDEIDFATLQKMYGVDPEDERRYSPPVCTGICRQTVSGEPDPAHISTSYIERQNLTLRMGNRRFTRLTNAHSKKWVNHALALFYFNYNFCRKHETLNGKTPAQAAGISDTRWTIADLVALLEREETKLAKGGRINREGRS